MNELTERLAEINQIAKVKEYLDRQKEENANKAFIIAIGIVLGVLMLAGIAAVIATIVNKRKCQKRSLYDDLDQYYDAEGEMNFSFDDEESSSEAETEAEEEIKESEESESIDE